VVPRGIYSPSLGWDGVFILKIAVTLNFKVLIRREIMSEQSDHLEKLVQIREKGLLDLKSINNEAELQQWRITHLGRNSAIMSVFTQLGQFSKDIRPVVGQQANQVKQALETEFNEKTELLKQKALERSLQTEKLDVTLPGRQNYRGRVHLANQTLREVYRIFGEMGFQVYRSRDVESDEYNFELLNIPPYHPARDMWDTFYATTPGVLLRTHTSPGQIRVMRERYPEPIRVILPGMCYRYEQISARSEIQFNQVEGIMVGKGVTFSNLKGTLIGFARRLFGQDVHTRFRPSYFPFTEPSAEMDVECFVCGGKGCSICKSSGWLEICGCGMVHPIVLQNGGYDPEEYTGFAFGMGTERLTLLRYRIDDIRYFWNNDIRFLEQF
jgi:phenylalanyl-tRNA synthetase alpha chain